VVGNYTGASILNVRTVLGGDGSPSNRLMISTGSGGGSTSIGGQQCRRHRRADRCRCHSAGAGRQWRDHRSDCIPAGGPGLRPGAFDYFLFPGGVSLGSQNSWFLHSSVPPAPPPDVPPLPPPTPAPFTPPLPPPPPPGAPPIPLFRPEVAVQSMLPSIAARWALVTLGTFNEHQGDSFSCAAI
jgi:autotransporter family porin